MPVCMCLCFGLGAMALCFHFIVERGCGDAGMGGIHVGKDVAWTVEPHNFVWHWHTIPIIHNSPRLKSMFRDLMCIENVM